MNTFPAGEAGIASMPDDGVRMPLEPAQSEESATTEMSMRRTGLSFQRTRLSSDRTLMSVIRTSLSLISFGFTIFQVFQKLESSAVIEGSGNEARIFGLALVGLGIVMLLVGIVYDLQFMRGLRRMRAEMVAQGLIHGQSQFPVSYTLVVALVLLVIGVGAIGSMAHQAGLL